MMGPKFWSELASKVGVSISEAGAPMVRLAAATQDAKIIPVPSKIPLHEARIAGFFKLAKPMGWGLYRAEDIDGGLGSIWSIEKDAHTGNQFLVKQVDPAGEVLRKTASQRVAVAPPGEEKVVKKLKEDSGVENPWAVAWSIHNKKKASVDPKKRDEVAQKMFGKSYSALPDDGPEQDAVMHSLEKHPEKKAAGLPGDEAEEGAELSEMAQLIQEIAFDQVRSGIVEDQGDVEREVAAWFESSYGAEPDMNAIREEIKKNYPIGQQKALHGGQQKQADMAKKDPKNKSKPITDSGVWSAIMSNKDWAKDAPGSNAHDTQACEDPQCAKCAEIDPHMTEHGIGPKPKLGHVAAADWEDKWKAFFDEWKTLPDDIRSKAERKCIDDRIAQLPEGSDFGSSDKWHTIYGEFSNSHVPGKMLEEVTEWLSWNRVAAIDPAAPEMLCEKCGTQTGGTKLCLKCSPESTMFKKPDGASMYGPLDSSASKNRKAALEGGLDAMTESYLQTALWAETDNSTESGGEPLDANYSISDIDPASLEKAKADCAAFEQKAGPLLEGIPREGQDVRDIVGHDFWLTRNGHGAGFWDGDYPKEIGEALTKLSKEFGECYIEVGDDGKIYLR